MNKLVGVNSNGTLTDSLLQTAFVVRNWKNGCGLRSFTETEHKNR